MKLLGLTLILSGLLSTATMAKTTGLHLAHKKQLTLPRIIGGEETPKGERPWMASLQTNFKRF